MNKLQFILNIFLWIGMSSPFAYADISSAEQSLKSRFHLEYERAKNLGEWSNSAYRLSYAHEVASKPKEYVGNTLRSLELQERAIQSTLASKVATDGVAQVLKNDLKTRIGLKLVQVRMSRECRYCRTPEAWNQHRKAVDAFFDFYDIRAAGTLSPITKRKFSGLPFFSSMNRKFREPLFQKRVITFHERLQNILEKISKNPNYELKENVMSIATEVCEGNKSDAIDLAALMLSRDSNVIKYFEYIPVHNPEFVRATARTPLLVRLITELDQTQRGSSLDFFSYNGIFSSPNVKNYYYWSSALTSKKLKEEGFANQDILELNAQFPRQYKQLRAYENFANEHLKPFSKKSVKLISGEDFKLDARQIMKMSAEGSRGVSTPHCGANLIDSLFE
jgi:hypothetical protein